MSGLEEENNDEDDSGYGPIRTENLKQHLKDQTPEMYDGEDMWASEDGMEEMEERLLIIAERVWEDAAEETEQNDRRVVQVDEIRNAFNNLLQPHNLMMKAAREMDQRRRDFLEVANESPLIEFDEVREQEDE